MALQKELLNEDLARQAYERGAISKETLDRMVQPTSAAAPIVEVTDVLPSVAKGAEIVAAAGANPAAMGSKIFEAARNHIAPAEANAAVNPNPEIVQTTEVSDELPHGALTTDKSAEPRIEQAAGAYNSISGLESAYNQQKKAITKAAEAGAEQAMQESAFQQGMYDEAEKIRLAEAERESARQKKIEQQQLLLDEKINAYSALPGTSQQKFANAGTGQKILMGLSMFLGAAPNSSGQNKAAQVMQQSVDADLAKAKSEVNTRESFYRDMMDAFKDERQADAAAKMAYLNNAQLKLNQIASQYKSPQILENAKLLNGKISEEMEKTKIAFQSAAQNKQSIELTDEVTGKIMRMPKEMQKDLLEAREVYDATKAAEKEIDSIYDGFDVGVSGYVPLTQGKAKLETDKAKIESAIRATMKGQGTIQESEIVRLVNPFLPNPTDTKARLGIKKDQLKKLLNTKNAGQINRLRNAGVLPIERKFSESAPIKIKGN